MTRDLKERAYDRIPKRWIASVFAVVGLAAATVFVLAVSVLSQLLNPDFRQLPLIIQNDWTISSRVDEIMWGEGQGIPLSGTFDCSPDLEVSAAIQFNRSMQLISEDGESLGILPMEAGPPARADAVCSAVPRRPFTALWVNMPEDFVPVLPTYAIIRYSASSDGYRTVTAHTNPFLITPPEGSP